MKLQEYRRYSRATLIQPQRTTLVLPAFDISADEWSGASRMLLEIPVGNNYFFSLLDPITKFGNNFVVAIRWPGSGCTIRYKLWEDVGEILNYPVYAGQRIGLNAVFEVWSTNTSSGYSNFLARILPTSVLLYVPRPGCQCVNPQSATYLTASDPSSITQFPNPFDGQDGEIDPEAPGGEIPTIETLAALYPDYYIFPASGYCKEADGNVVYPSHITPEEANFWQLLLEAEWPVTEYSDRHLAWYFYNHIGNFYDFNTRFSDGTPTPNTDDPFIEFAAPWTLTYIWKP